MGDVKTYPSMPNRMVQEDEIQKALDWLRDNAKAMGEAKARLIKSQHMVAHIEALEFRMSNATSDAKKKADARASERYVQAILEEAEAAGQFEQLRSLREAAALKIGAWQSECANFRSMKI